MKPLVYVIAAVYEVVDYGSKDWSSEIYNLYPENNRRINLIQYQHRKLVSAIKTGILTA